MAKKVNMSQIMAILCVALIVVGLFWMLLSKTNAPTLGGPDGGSSTSDNDCNTTKGQTAEKCLKLMSEKEIGANSEVMAKADKLPNVTNIDSTDAYSADVLSVENVNTVKTKKIPDMESPITSSQ